MALPRCWECLCYGREDLNGDVILPWLNSRRALTLCVCVARLKKAGSYCALSDSSAQRHPRHPLLPHGHLPAKYTEELRHSTQRLIRSSYFQVCNIAEASFRLDAAELCVSWLAFGGRSLKSNHLKTWPLHRKAKTRAYPENRWEHCTN